MSALLLLRWRWMQVCVGLSKHLWISETGTRLTTQKGKLTSGRQRIFSATTKSVQLIVFHVEISVHLRFCSCSEDVFAKMTEQHLITWLKPVVQCLKNDLILRFKLNKKFLKFWKKSSSLTTCFCSWVNESYETEEAWHFFGWSRFGHFFSF